MKSGICTDRVEVRKGVTKSPGIVLNHGDALIIVDVQKDFLPGGNLAVPNGDAVLAPLNRYQAMFVARNLPIFLSGDCHPPNHCSFKAQGGPWPPHCVANTPGAAFAKKLDMPTSAAVVRKGQEAERDVYSAFDGTDLAERLSNRDVRRLFVGGLATDYCVLHTTRDALNLGFETFLLRDAIRAVNVRPGDRKKAEAEMTELGAEPLQLEDLVHAPRSVKQVGGTP